MRVVDPLLGTRIEIGVDAEYDAVRRRAEDAAVAEIQRLEQVFTVHDPASALHAFRRSGTTDVSELRAVLDIALQWREWTDGLFDPAVGRLMARWERAEAADVAPDTAELARIATDSRSAAPDFTSLNAIAKGWIADQAATTAHRTDGVTGVWINAGGDVVHRGHGSVAVGIEDPDRPYDNATPLTVVELSGEALATSGGSRRFWTIGGRRYTKVLDPRSGQPVDRVSSATVIAADAASADVLATVALVAEVDHALSMVGAAGAACLLVLADGTVVTDSERFGRH